MSNKTDNAQLTKGPWFVWNDGVYAGTPTEKTSGKLVGHTAQICTVDADISEVSEEEADAVLFLIAAAPDLKREGKALRVAFEQIINALELDANETAINFKADGKLVVSVSIQDLFNRMDKALNKSEGMHSTEEEGATE